MNNRLRYRINKILDNDMVLDNIDRIMSRATGITHMFESGGVHIPELVWVYCGIDNRSKNFYYTKDWDKVTCKNCLRSRDKN